MSIPILTYKTRKEELARAVFSLSKAYDDTKTMR